jgi:hypothetical protein
MVRIYLWDDQDNFIMMLCLTDTERLKVRSLVEVIPMFAVEIMHVDLFKELKEFQKQITRSYELTRFSLINF